MATVRKVYQESLRVGDELPLATHGPLDRVAFARYAGASGDYAPQHVDEDWARRSGLPSVAAHGMLALGWLGQLAHDWLKGGQIKRLSGRFVKLVWPGDEITCRGRIVERRREGGEYFVELELWAENQKGELVVKGNATGKLFYSAEDEDRQRRGLPALIVDDAAPPTLTDAFERAIGRPAEKSSKGAAPAKPLATRTPAPPAKTAAPKQAAPKLAAKPAPVAKKAAPKKPSKPSKSSKPSKPAPAAKKPAPKKPAPKKPSKPTPAAARKR